MIKIKWNFLKKNGNDKLSDKHHGIIDGFLEFILREIL